MLGKILHSERARFLMVGGWNTLFGYSLGVTLFTLLAGKWHTVAIALMTNCISIAMSFTTYKLFVFKTRANWWIEFIRACIVYANMALVSIGLIWIFFEVLNFNIWLAQGLTLILTVLMSYVSHKKFTFIKK